MKIAQLIIISFIFVGCSKNEFDIIISNGTIVDGSGQGSYQADIGIVDDRIVKIADLSESKSVHIINAASASIANHASLDFTKQAKIKSVNFNESALITAFSNDFGYENWVKKAVEFYGQAGDTLILISSSGKSLNIVNAAQYACKNNINVITFTGFDSNNPLSLCGDINFWLDSKAYNII